MDTKKLKKVKDPFLRNKKRRKLSRKSLASLKRSLIANANLASQQNTSKYVCKIFPHFGESDK